MRKRTRRKVMPLVNPIQYVLGGMAAADKGLTDSIVINMTMAYGSLRTGNLTKKDWDILADCINYAQALALHVGIGREYANEIGAARIALLALGDRLLRDGRVTASALELNTLRTFVEINEAQLRACTNADVERASKRVAELKRSAPKFSPGAAHAT